MLTVLSLLAGLVLLVFGAEWLVRGATTIALAARIPAALVGLTVVAAGTSLPELFVSVQAALRDAPDLATGNVVGSNFYNIGLILGLSAVIRPLRVTEEAVRLEWPVVFAAAMALLLLGFDGILRRPEGMVLLVAHLGYIGWLVARARAGRAAIEAPEEGPTAHPLRSGLEIAVGLVGLTLGSRLLIGGATGIAELLGLSERVIGLTVVSLGTSLPELATSVVAAWRGQDDIAVGNILGSNIFNVLAILGVTAIVTPVPVHPEMVRWDLPWMLGITLLLLPVLLTGRRVDRYEGAGLLGLTATYTALLL